MSVLQVDLFFYREPEETKEPQEEEAAPLADYGEYNPLGATDNWGTSGAIPEEQWAIPPQPAIPAVAATGWPGDAG